MHLVKTVFKFIVSGGTAAVTQLLILSILTEWVGLWYLYSSVVGFLFAVMVSFILQKFWTFNNHSLDVVHHQFGFYLIVTLINLGLNTGLLYVLVEFYQAHYLVAQIAAGLLIAFESFFVYRYLFRHR